LPTEYVPEPGEVVRRRLAHIVGTLVESIQ